MHDTSIDSDRGCLMLQAKWVLSIARFKRVRLRWKQLSWETSEVPDPQRCGILPVLANGLSYRKVGGYSGLGGICKPVQRSYYSHRLKKWWKHITK